MSKKMPPGIVQRHGRRCARNGRCSCSFEAWVWSPRDGRKISRRFPTVSAAKSWRHDAESAKSKGKLRAPTRRTLSDAAEAWLAGAKAGAILKRSGERYKPAVIRGYEADLRRYVLDDLGGHRLSAIHRRDLQALIDRLVAERRSASKVHNVVMPIRSIYRYALERDEVELNPTTNLRLPTPTGVRDRTVTPGEADALFEPLPEDNRALWWTAFYAGLRRGELRALLWKDVDLDANVIAVKHSWDEKEGPVAPKSAKGKRRVPLVPTLRRLLVEHKLRTGRDGDDFVFGRTANAPFTPTNVRKRALQAWAAVAIGAFLRGKPLEVELEPVCLQELRHSYVSLMHDAGFSLERIGDYVGHSSAYMTDRYRHLLDGHEAEAADRFERYLSRALSRSD